jgi:hypothetical protein
MGNDERGGGALIFNGNDVSVKIHTKALKDCTIAIFLAFARKK